MTCDGYDTHIRDDDVGNSAPLRPTVTLKHSMTKPRMPCQRELGGAHRIPHTKLTSYRRSGAGYEIANLYSDKPHECGARG
jgi:hypothetical protein